MPDFKTILLFCIRFVLVCALFLAPWPGLDAAYGRFFRSIGNLIFSSTASPHFVRFQKGGTASDTKVLAGNLDFLDDRQDGPMKQLDLDTRLTSFMPVSLIIALILATPIPWPRRVRSLILGVICFYGFLFLSIALWLLQKPDGGPGGLAIVALSPFARAIDNHLVDILFGKMDVGSFVPIVIWALVTFRRCDWTKLIEPPKTRELIQPLAPAPVIISASPPPPGR